MQRRDYKMITEPDWSKIVVEDYPSLMGSVVNSCITMPVDKETVTIKEGQKYLQIKGYACGNGEKGTRVAKVEVSVDDGKSWREAKISHEEIKPDNSKVFSWTLWKYQIKLSQFENSDEITPMVRAITSDGEVQKGEWKDMFNVRGLFNTTPHKITINIEKEEKQ